MHPWSSSSGAHRVCRVRPGGSRREGAARDAPAGAAVSHPSLSAARRCPMVPSWGRGKGWMNMADLLWLPSGKLTKSY
jgi:hypothetical protein